MDKTNQNYFHESRITLALLTFFVLFDSAILLFSLVLLSKWFDIPNVIAWAIPGATLFTFVFFLIKNGFKHHTKEQGVRFKSFLCVISIFLLSVPVAYLIAKQILQNDIIAGKYPFYKYTSYADFQAVTNMRIWSLTITMVVFACIAFGITRIKGLWNNDTMSVISIVIPIVLLACGFGKALSSGSDYDWYYSSKKALANDIDRYYRNLNNIYELCSDYNKVITPGYDKYLSVALVDTVFYNINNGKPIVSLADKDAKYQHLKNMLMLYLEGWWDGAPERLPFIRNDRMRIMESEKQALMPLSKTIDESALTAYSDTINDVEENLEHRLRYCQLHQDDIKATEPINELLSIGEDVKNLAGSFMFFHEHPTTIKMEKVTWEAEEKLKLIDERFKSFRAKYNKE